LRQMSLALSVRGFGVVTSIAIHSLNPTSRTR
jgi:hypothetical protein